MHSIFTFSLLFALTGSIPSILSATKPSHIGETRQLMLDRSIIDNLDGASLRQGIPSSGGVILRSEKPWEGDAFYIFVIFYHDGYYRMIYRGVDTRTDSETYYLCLALSKDGIQWERPVLGLFEFDGNKNNNIIADEDGNALYVSYAFYDPRPETPENARIKAVRMLDGDRTAGGTGKGLQAQFYGSPDGRKFKKLELSADLKSDRINAFDGGSIFWSDVEQLFVGYFRWWDENPEPHARLLNDWMIVRPGVRSVFRSVSTDLRSWSKPIPMTFGGTPREHIYENSTYPYFRAPHLYIALANRFNPGRRALTLEEEKALEIRSLPRSNGEGRYTFASDANDLFLMTTTANMFEYDRPFMEAFMRPGQNIGNWSSRCNYPPMSGGTIQTGPKELSFYVSRQHLQKANHIERMSLRLDGFVSVNAPYAGGEMVTVPIIFEGDHLEANFSTSGAGEIRVELQDENGKPLPGYGLEDCDLIIGDRIDGLVRWHGQASVGAYAGKPVRLRFQMVDADLYSFRFKGSGVSN